MNSQTYQYTTEKLLLTTTTDDHVCEVYHMPRKWRFFASMPEARRIIEQMVKDKKVAPDDRWRIEVVRTTTFNQYYKNTHSFIRMSSKPFKKTLTYSVQHIEK